jgi:hypothetical protein
VLPSPRRWYTTKSSSARSATGKLRDAQAVTGGQRSDRHRLDAAELDASWTGCSTIATLCGLR